MRTNGRFRRIISRCGKLFSNKFPRITIFLKFVFGVSWFTFRASEIASVVILVVLAGRGIETSYQWANRKIVDVRYQAAEYLAPQTVRAPMTEAEIIEYVTQRGYEHGVNPIVGLATVSGESANNPYRWRYEKIWEEQYGSKVPCKGKNPEECKLLYSSIGLMQISYVIWKDFCGLKSPVELFDPKINTDCGYKIMVSCLYNDLDNEANNSKLLRTCYRKYNGSGELAERYADRMMESISKFTIPDRELFTERAAQLLQAKVEQSADVTEPVVVKAELKPEKKKSVALRSVKVNKNNDREVAGDTIKLARR